MGRRAKPKAPSRPKIPVLEWIAAGFGGLLALVLLGLVLADAAKEHEPPVLLVKAAEAQKTPAGWRTPFEVRNEGGETAAGVHVIGTLADGEVARVIVDVVPGGSTAEGGLIFQGDPRAGLVLRAEGFVQP